MSLGDYIDDLMRTMFITIVILLPLSIIGLWHVVYYLLSHLEVSIK